MKMYFKLFILVLLFTSACKDKNTTKNTYTLTGTLLKNCDGEPAANTELALQLESNEFLSVEWGGSTTRFKTDANGYFSVKYQTVSNSGISIVLFNNVGYTRVLSAIPQNQNINLGNIYVSRMYNLIIKLNVKDLNMYDENDTLFYTHKSTNDPSFIKYPFLSTLDTINIIDIQNKTYNSSPKEKVAWGFNKRQSIGSKTVTIQNICKDYNEVTLEI